MRASVALFTDHFKNILVLLIQNEVQGSLLNLDRRGHIAAKRQKDVVYLARGKGTKDDLLDDRRGLILVIAFFVILIVRGRCAELIGKSQAAAAIRVLEFSTKGEAFHMDLDFGRRHNGLLSSRIDDDTPASSFQHQTARGHEAGHVPNSDSGGHFSRAGEVEVEKKLEKAIATGKLIVGARELNARDVIAESGGN